ncbi:MAG TPA: PhnD/SsuA/transferrin family substrate-binding protein [Spirochaetota bacterium]|nr:PhnD/SsuA/transferrin family substrate-binding protein [Spirochaetota bacterium]HPR49809.1 PhnD/SsuA/transferrin family substrate-binding protein [Spirochaetota bacterium]
MKRSRKIFLLMLFFLFSIFIMYDYNTVQGAGNSKINFVIVNAGGSEIGEQGDQIITQFLDILTKETSLKRSMVEGQYFNDISLAKAFIKKNSNSFVMGSLGFFLSNRDSYNLVPLSLIIAGGKNTEQYYVIVKKGSYKSLDSLKGKVMSGNVLYEDTRFINNVIFDGKINITEYFKVQPTARPLSAVRKVTTGAIDAVLLTGMQYESLKKIQSTFQNIDVVYRSAEFPRVGFMMVDTESTQSVKQEILNAVVKMTRLEEGKKVCQNFGITGFENIPSESLNEAISKYSSGN